MDEGKGGQTRSLQERVGGAEDRRSCQTKIRNCDFRRSKSESCKKAKGLGPRRG